MCNTLLGEFCKTHSNWEELLTAEPYHLKVKRDDDYVMFSYNQLCSDFTNPIVREARGIIFKDGEWNYPVCWAFNKFGNWGESYVPELDWTTTWVSEKIDGSLIKVWWNWHGGWHVSTNGTIDAYKAELSSIKYTAFGNYFEDTIKKYYKSFDNFVEDLDVNCTYLFELVGPYNRVVIPYEESAVYFLGAKNKFTGKEIHDASELTKLPRPKIFPLTSINDCVKLAATFDWDKEGFVACDGSFNRVKIKSPAYVKAHFARNNSVINKKHLINIIINNEIEEFLCYASDYKDELRDCQKLINAYYKIGNSFAATVRKARSMSRGDFAGLVKTFPSMYHDLLFKNYDKDLSAEEYSSGWSENKWEDYLVRLEKLKNEWFNND